jgi:hypothetical protein
VQGVRPYSHIPERDLHVWDRNARHRAAASIGYLEARVKAAIPRILPAGVDLIRRLPAPTNDKVFGIMYASVLEMLYKPEVNTVRKGELSYQTVYNKVREWDIYGTIFRKRKHT